MPPTIMMETAEKELFVQDVSQTKNKVDRADLR